MLEEIDHDDMAIGRSATVGIRFTGVLHHGTDHRSQICTAITALGIKPPRIHAVDFGLEVGRLTEVYPGGR